MFKYVVLCALIAVASAAAKPGILAPSVLNAGIIGAPIATPLSAGIINPLAAGIATPLSAGIINPLAASIAAPIASPIIRSSIIASNGLLAPSPLISSPIVRAW